MRRRLGALLLLPMLTLMAACAPVERPAGPDRAGLPYLDDGLYIAHDGARLPYRVWRPAAAAPVSEAPAAEAVIVAVHGFNDYSAFFDLPGRWFAARGVIAYAYDQRGFGLAPGHGFWPGTETLARDLVEFVAAVRRRHPGLPVYVLGASMGGAVALVAFRRPGAPEIAGTILSAPAVWGRETMPFYQRWALAAAVRVMPGARLRPTGLKIQPSDNIEMLRALGRDPLVIKDTRVDAVYGLVGLMDAALAAAPAFDRRLLLLYGRRDDIIPEHPIERLIARLPARAAGRQRVVVYPDAYHMLLRGLDAERVWREIRRWVGDPPPPRTAGGG